MTDATLEVSLPTDTSEVVRVTARSWDGVGSADYVRVVVMTPDEADQLASELMSAAESARRNRKNNVQRSLDELTQQQADLADRIERLRLEIG